MRQGLAAGVASGLIPRDSLQCQGRSNTHLPAAQAPAGTCLCFPQASEKKSACPHLGIHHCTCLEEAGPLQLSGTWLPLGLTNNVLLGRPAVLQQMIKSPWRRWRWMNLRSHYPSCSSFSIPAASSTVCIFSHSGTAPGGNGLHPTAGAIPYFPCIILWIPLPTCKLELKPVQLYVSFPWGWQGPP